MSHLSNVANKGPMLRVSASIILVFCFAAPLVWLFSNLVAYGLRSFPLDQYRRASVIGSCLEIESVAEEGTIMKRIFIGMALAFAFVTGMALTTVIAQIAS